MSTIKWLTVSNTAESQRGLSLRRGEEIQKGPVRAVSPVRTAEAGEWR